MKPKREKKCSYCKDKFVPYNSLQKFCFKNECIQEHNLITKKKKVNKEKRAFNWNDKTWLKQEAQFWFNKFIRLRDSSLCCISCGTDKDLQFHAGHYKPAGGYSYLRFDENNVHKQCSVCNNHRSGNLVHYRVALIEKIGIDEVERLEKPNQLKNWSIKELQDIIEKYKMKYNSL